MLFFFFFFSKILITFLGLFSPFIFFFFRKILSFTCFFLESFFVFWCYLFTIFIYRKNFIKKNIFMSHISTILIFFIRIFLIRLFLIRIFFVRIFSIRIRRNFYIINNIFRNLFSLTTYLHFLKTLVDIIFTCSKNRIDQKLLIRKYIEKLLLVFYWCGN